MSKRSGKRHGTERNSWKRLARAVLEQSYRDLNKRLRPKYGGGGCQDLPSPSDREDAREFLSGGGTYEIIRELAEL